MNQLDFNLSLNSILYKEGRYIIIHLEELSDAYLKNFILQINIFLT